MAALLRRTRTACQCQRAFSTSAPRPITMQWEKNDPEALANVLPAYPHGPTRLYKQSKHGLYGGQRIQTGNNVGEKSKTKTRRTWRPNIFNRKLFSNALNRSVQVRVSSRVLRTIDKLGGLDEYLLGEKEMRIKELGESGWWLRWAIMQTPAIKKRFADERRLLGLPEQSDETDLVEETLDDMTPEELLEEDADALATTETELSLEESEAIPMDDAFEIEQPPGLPPLKFRVGKGRHVVLTPDGWRRTRPDPTRRDNIAKEALAKRCFPNFVEARVAECRGSLKKPHYYASEGEALLAEREKAALMAAAQAVDPESETLPMEGAKPDLLEETLEAAQLVNSGGETLVAAGENDDPLAETSQPVITETENVLAEGGKANLRELPLEVVSLSKAQKTNILKAVKRDAKSQLSAMVDALYAEIKAAKEEANAQRQREKRARKDAERATDDQEESLLA